MSIADHPPTNAPDPRTGAWPLGDFGTRYAARTVRGKLPALWSDRALRLAMLWGLAAWIILEGAFLVWVHRNAEGDSSPRVSARRWTSRCPRARLPPASGPWPRSATTGSCTTGCRTTCSGGYDAHEHMDEVLYRYQRIGIPLIAGGTGKPVGVRADAAAVVSHRAIRPDGARIRRAGVLAADEPAQSAVRAGLAGLGRHPAVAVAGHPGCAGRRPVRADPAGRSRRSIAVVRAAGHAAGAGTRGVRGLRLCHLRADGRGPLCLAGQGTATGSNSFTFPGATYRAIGNRWC